MPIFGGSIRAPSIFSVCVDSSNKTSFSGRLYHCYSVDAIDIPEPVSFLHVMDHVFDSVGVPQAAVQARIFKKSKTAPNSKREVAEILMEEKEVSSKRGEKGTFVVRIQSRQNSTWQGKVTWAEKNQSQNFRSALELLKLIDSALDQES